ncbi:MAG TPA: PfkB family carbohydrate kinase [Anaerolineaceae bacterium]|jgi:sugar/nucleoside kinase (ribokinase family)|nr:PfkB family carbohydrate kinase [Anaerolineaceae bacterium]
MTDTSTQYDAIFVGNYTKDTIITPEGTRYADGGGMNYAAHAASALGLKAAVVTRLAKEDEHVVNGIRAHGIDCYPVFSPSSTLMTLEYKTSDVDKRSLYVKATAGTIRAADLAGLAARAIVVSPSLRGEVEADFFETQRKRQGVLLSADVQGFVRVLRGESLVYEPWPDMERVLRQLDVLKTDAVEAAYLTGEQDIEKAASRFASLGAKEVLLSHSEGILVHAEGKFYHYLFHANSMSGRSGRGDTCVGSYVAKRLTLPPYEAGKWSAATTSLKIERLGVFNRSVAEVEEFISRHYAD